MPLEACMIIMDNSEFMRNGDYPPNRFLAQNDAISVIFNVKTGSNPENTVGLMSSGGDSPQVLATLTQDIGKILSAISKSTITGSSDILTSLNVASLALKHRENKNQRQRIVCFVGSPIDPSGGGREKEIEDSLIKLGKKLKKNNVAVDIIVFGDEGMKSEESLRKFIEAVGSGENSHIITIPTGPHLLSDLIASSPILASEGGAAVAGGVDAEGFPTGDFGDVEGAPQGGASGGDDFGGVDPNMDPELAMVIRMSLQEAEERERREREAAGGNALPITDSTVPAPAPASSNESAPLLSTHDEDISMEAEHPALASTPAATTTERADAEMVINDEDDEDEEAAMLKAIAMSMESQGGDAADEEKKD